MNIFALNCPNCYGDIEIEEGMKICFCKYCGSKIFCDNEVIINKNVNINRVNRYIDDAKIKKEEYKYKSDNRDIIIGVMAGIGIPLVILIVWLLYSGITNAIAKSQGKVSVGSYEELVGEDYKSVVAHFESAGFTNIETIDLDDAGIKFWKDGEVVKVSVEGNSTFGSMDYFNLDAKVVISFH